MNLTLKLSTMLIVSLTMAACATLEPTQPKYGEYIEPEVVYSFADQTRENYDFGNVRVDITPHNVQYGEMDYNVVLHDVGEPIFGYVQAKVDISPARKETADVILAVTINNQMDRILRLQSSIVTMIVNDKRVKTAPLKVEDPGFNDQTILPHRSETLYLRVQDVTRFGSSGKLELSIYDLPVDISPSGEVAKRDNVMAVYEYRVNQNRLPVLSDRISVLVPEAVIRKYASKSRHSEAEILRDFYGRTDSTAASQ